MGILRVVSRALGGALLVNAVPHGVNGAVGRPFPTPFANPPGVGLSPPATNLAWSAANLAAGAVVLRRGIRSPAEALALMLGAAATAYVLARHFSSVMAGGTGLLPPSVTASSSRPLAQRLSEPIALVLAGRPWMPVWAVIHHTGRRSGTAYSTPIAVVPTRDPRVVLIGLPWGRDTNWARNVIAAGGASLMWRGQTVTAVEPRIVDPDEAGAAAKPPFDTVVRRMPGALLLTRT